MKTVATICLLLIAPYCFGQTPSAVDTTPKTKCPDVPAIKNPVKNAEAPAGTADLNSVIATVQAALKCYEDNRGSGPDGLPHLQQAVFDFKTTTGKIGGIDVNFFIFKIKASKEKDTTNQISFTYTLPKPKPSLIKAKIPPQPLADAIVADMQSAAAAIKDAATLGKLNFNKLSLVLQFGVQFDGSVGINVPIQLVTLGASGEYKKNEVQTVTLTFAEPEPPVTKVQP
jgi:hypothetical protein